MEEDQANSLAKLSGKCNNWNAKISQLLMQCKKEGKANQMLFNRLQHVRRITRKLQRENRFIAKELDRHGDSYMNFDTYFASSVLTNGTAAATTVTAKPTVRKPLQKQHTAKHEKPTVEKDPNAPKKPANAFFMYCQQKRNDILLGNPTLSHHDLTKVLAKSWNQLNSAEKLVYYEMYEHDKERYEKQMKEYAENGQFTPIAKTKDIPTPSSREGPTVPTASSVDPGCLRMSPGPPLVPLSNPEVMPQPCFDLMQLPSPPATDRNADATGSFQLDID